MAVETLYEYNECVNEKFTPDLKLIKKWERCASGKKWKNVGRRPQATPA